jgi:hypothetical protein
MLSMLIFAAASAAQPRIVIPSTGVPATSTVGYPLCHDKGVRTVDARPNAPVRAQKLNELPNANDYLTVLRIDEKGCQKPAIVAYDIGSAPKKQR